MIKLYWRFFLNANRIDKAEKITKKILDILGEGNCEIILLEKYWKDEKLFNLEVSQKLFVSFSLEVLLNEVSKISNHWTITLPDDLMNSKNIVELTGLSESKNKILGLKWVSFMLEEYNLSPVNAPL